LHGAKIPCQNQLPVRDSTQKSTILRGRASWAVMSVAKAIAAEEIAVCPLMPTHCQFSYLV